MKYKLRKIKKSLSVYMSFPQVWVFASILALTIVAFFASIYAEEKYWGSLSSNIFAGLVTGLVISLLSGVRQVYTVVQQKKMDWLQELQELIRDYFSMDHDFLVNNYRGLDRDDFIYDMGARANWISEHIIQSIFDKRLPFNSMNYCKKNYAFDAKSFAEKCESLHVALYEQEYTDDKRSVRELFRDVDSEIKSLNSKVYRDIKDIEIKIATSQRSIL